jgi:hypothetical protein
MQNKIIIAGIATIIALSITVMLLVNVPETHAQETNGCSETIAKVKAEHLRVTSIRDNSLYGAGLILALHYVKEDCSTAKDMMGELLNNLWIAQSEYKTDKKIVDQISTGVRFVDKLL